MEISCCLHHCHLLSGLAQLPPHDCVDQGRPKLSPDSPLLRSVRCGACSHHAPEISIEHIGADNQRRTDVNTITGHLLHPGHYLVENVPLSSHTKLTEKINSIFDSLFKDATDTVYKEMAIFLKQM